MHTFFTKFQNNIVFNKLIKSRYNYMEKYCSNNISKNLGKDKHKPPLTDSEIPQKVSKLTDMSDTKIDIEKIKKNIINKYDSVTFEGVPLKAESDKKEYLVMKLKNGLTALLISDVNNVIDLNEASHSESEFESGDETSSEGSDNKINIMDGSKTGSKRHIHSEGESSNKENLLGKNLIEINITVQKGSISEGVSSDSESETKEGGDSQRKNNLDEEDESSEDKERLAACALTVGVGSFSDPETIPGLAHFLEHMVFMGSKKFPKENDFDSFTKTRGGSSNAVTECEYTTFYFECPDKHLRNSMDRFANFFVSPLMTKETMTREREAVESEFKLNSSSDSARMEQLFCSIAPVENPAHKFMWGNLITLQQNVTDDVLHSSLRKFWEKYYSAHRMKVAVQARLPLDTLGIWVAEYFGDITSNEEPPITFPSVDSPFKKELFNKIYTVLPVKDTNKLQLSWALPPVLHLYKSKPLEYLAFLIGHEGEGSILSYLQEKLWGLKITAGNGDEGIENNTIYSLFTISITLTEEGIKNVEQIIASIFSYIKLLQLEGPSEYIFKEEQLIEDISFRFSEETDPSDFVEDLSRNMLFYPPADYIAGDKLLYDYKPEVISDILKLMTPDNVNIILLSKLASKEINLDQTEKWFGTKYNVKDIPGKWLQEWLNCKIYPSFHLPKPNIYIPSDFDLLPITQDLPEYPQKVINNEFMELWHKQDTKFKLPFAYVKAYFISPIASLMPQNNVLCSMFTTLFILTINKTLYSASLAGLSFSLTNSGNGLELTVNGFNHKIHLLMRTILNEIMLFSKNTDNFKDLFEPIKEELRRSYLNSNLKVSNVANDVRSSILLSRYWSSLDNIEAIHDITFEKFQQFSKSLFEHLYIKCLIQGNISAENAINIARDIKEIFDYKQLLTGTYPQIRARLLPAGEQIIRVQSFNEEDTNCNVTNYYQCGLNTIEESILIDIFMLLMKEPLFDQLRTQEQLAYDVDCVTRRTQGVKGFSITVNSQAEKFHVEHVELRISEFLESLRKSLKTMKLDYFNQIKESLKILKLQEDNDLEEEVQRNWSEITYDEYIFDRKKREIKYIDSASLQDLDHYVNKILESTGEDTHKTKCLRKLSVQVDAEYQKTTNVNELKNEANQLNNKDRPTFQIKTSNNDNLKHKFIKDIEQFKSELYLFPYHNSHYKNLSKLK